MRYALFASVLLAACASVTAESLQGVDTAQVCYLAVTQPDNQLARAELDRRNANCLDHAAEVRRMMDDDARANAGTTRGLARPSADGGMRAGMAGGMGGVLRGGMRGY